MDARIEEAVDRLRRVAAAAHESGRTTLGERELLPVFEALGWRVPRMRIVGPDEPPPDLAAFPGERVVLKLLAPGLAHRTEIGGVRVVARTTDAVQAALADLRARCQDPDAAVAVQEWIGHDHEPGGEILLGARWTEEFGPVVTVGPGGVSAEHLASMVSASGGVIHLSADQETTGSGPSSPIAPLRASPLLPLVLGTLRGRRARVTEAGLAQTLGDFLALVDAATPAVVAELEINPLTFVDGVPVVLDALGRLETGAAAGEAVRPPKPPAMPTWRRAGVEALLRPRSVALVGVSKGENPGRTILRNVLRMGFPADHIRVVKPGLDRLDGCACVPDVDALDPPADLLVVSVGAADVPALLARVARGRRARSIVLVSGGLGEGGANTGGAELVQAALREAGAAAPVVSGGNCLGVRSHPGRCDTLFIPDAKLGLPSGAPHPVALVSQSGAFAIARASALRWLNPRYVVTLGNQIDLTVGEYLEVLADDTEVRVFACYVEGFRPLDGLRFLRVARRLRREGRAVVLYRTGRTPRGARAAVSHTASLAGDYDVTRALARDAGVMVADSLDEFDDLVSVATLLDRRTAGVRLGALSNAGFECVTLADGAGALEFASLSDFTRCVLERLVASKGLGDIVAPRNPMDLTPIFDDRAFVGAAAAILADDDVDVGVVACVPLTPALRTLPHEGLEAEGGVLAGLRALRRATPKAWVAVVEGGPAYDAFADGLSGAGIPVFRRSDRAVSALSRWVRWRLG